LRPDRRPRVGRFRPGQGVFSALADGSVWVRSDRILSPAEDGFLVDLDAGSQVMFETRCDAVKTRAGFGVVRGDLEQIHAVWDGIWCCHWVCSYWFMLFVSCI
jgi:hypothetical protein